MSGNEQLRTPIRQNADGVRIPYFLEKCFSHIVSYVVALAKTQQSELRTLEAVSSSDLLG
jgi:hypothetical protein